MWTATIGSKDFTNGVLTVGVVYTNGVDTFSEPYKPNVITDLDVIITNRLNQLNTNDSNDASYPLGVYTPSVAQTVQPAVTVSVDTLSSAVETLKSLATLVDLKVIDSTDANYVAALQAAKNKYATSVSTNSVII